MDNQDNKNRKKEDSQKKSELELCKNELHEWKEKWVRARADLENFTKRVEKEKIEWIRIAHSEVLKDLLTIVDDFDRALHLKEQTDVSSQVKPFLEGFIMISKSLYKFLEKYGITEITETTFDPQLHEAIAQIESKDHNSGEIVEVMQKGFLIKDVVLRPAKVVVAK